MPTLLRAKYGKNMVMVGLEEPEFNLAALISKVY